MRTAAPIVVVGASVAGLTVAESLRAEGYTGAIELVGDEPHLPYSRPPLSKQILAGGWPEERALLRPAALLADAGIEVRTGCRATGLDLARSRVAIDGRWRGFSRLVVATGLRARRLAGADEVASLRTLDDARTLRPALLAARRVVVVGGGVLGQELAAVAAGTGADVTLVHNRPALSLGPLGPLVSDRLVDLHRRHGVDLRLGTPVTGAERDPSGAWRVTLDDGSRLEADLVLASLGGIPNTEWLEGNDLDLSDGLRCDAAGRAAPDVYAVGDVARWYQPVLEAHQRRENQTSAIEQAMAVAHHLVHGEAPAPGPTYFWSDQYDVKIQAVGSFDPGGVLEPLDSPTGDLCVARIDGRVSGVVGWNAGRAFRTARALVQPPRPTARAKEKHR